jgi:hypothetical protein
MKETIATRLNLRALMRDDLRLDHLIVLLF